MPYPAICSPSKVYVWEWPVRITHWLNGISILGAVGDRHLYRPYPMLTSPPVRQVTISTWAWAKLIHFYAAIVFMTSVGAHAHRLDVRWQQVCRWDKFVPGAKRSATRDFCQR